MEIERMSAKQLEAKLAKQNAITSKFCDQFIQLGRGHERFSEIRANSDALSIAYSKELDIESALYQEKQRRLTSIKQH